MAAEDSYGLVDQLAAAGRRRHAAEEERHASTEFLAAEVRRARAANLSAAEIAAAAGVSRQTVHELLKREPGS